jgi:glutamate-ammonia-ligase adenylyltransferase
VLGEEAAEELIATYTFLRQVEHRIQLLGDQQSHSVPTDEESRTDLARRTGFSSLHAFDSALQMHREHARNWYEAILVDEGKPTDSARDEVVARTGRNATVVTQWIDDLQSSASFYESLIENESSLSRVVAVADRAPALVPYLRRSIAVTEQVMSGEVLEANSTVERFKRSGDVPAFAASLRTEWLRSALCWVLQDGFDYGRSVADSMDEAVAAILRECGCRFSVVALGSYGAREMSVFSDLDVLFVRDEALDHEESEKEAQHVLAMVQALRRAGAPIELDLRLRPEGKKGRLVQTEESIRLYDKASMEPWERLAISRARVVGRDGPLPDALKEAAFGRHLDQATLESLEKMKRRVETERVPVQFRRRHIKLGPGGQDDVLWLVQLLWWQNSAGVDLQMTSVAERLRELARIGVLNAVETDQLGEAWRFMSRLRLHLALLGYNDEVLPENPDKLARLGLVSRVGRENEVIEAFEGHTRIVRGLFSSTMERLRE